ncbi:N-acetyltransferase [Bacillus sp. CECT 9360]|uniref:GNAT family N-acetyltransferase n=1 Tax=Bacillus sp. CECT 9360 TaxID=2845821 RepID=UPI001E5CC18A|nr:N-acetyltransferase [Bacillus sp. CECT 9360]CAH0347442.1 hypothetical protein BCI9360_03840 [Bacillus sp. CECT 9360]
MAFGQENEAKLISAIRNSEEFISGLSLVAETESGELIGHILFSIIYIDLGMEKVPTLGLAPMAVKPEYQNQGIGSTLVKRGLEVSGEMGFEHVAVLGHPTFYPKFGFISSIEKGIESSFPVPNEVFMVCELKDGS